MGKVVKRLWKKEKLNLVSFLRMMPAVDSPGWRPWPSPHGRQAAPSPLQRRRDEQVDFCNLKRSHPSALESGHDKQPTDRKSVV